VACAVASAALDVMVQERLVDRVREQVIPAFAARWQQLADHPSIGEARSVGLIGALELVRDKGGRQRFAKELRAGERCRDLCIEQGLVMRAVGDTMIVAPPLVTTDAQLDELVAKARRAVDLTVRSLAA
jgi:putrescine aminotransferase